MSPLIITRKNGISDKQNINRRFEKFVNKKLRYLGYEKFMKVGFSLPASSAAKGEDPGRIERHCWLKEE